MAPNMPAKDGGAAAPETEETVRGTVDRITFQNAENGYAIAKLMPEKARTPVTILGTFPNLVVGESLLCRGTWSTHPQWGRQMQVSGYEVVRPATVHAIKTYLGSGMIKGIGPVMASRIVDAFGLDALDVIEDHPEKLRGVGGIGEKRALQIREAWIEQREVRNIMLFLQGHGVSPAYATKIFRTYGGRAIEVFERNPYQLAQDVWGIGFKVADRMAQRMGVAAADPRRIEAGVAWVLAQAVNAGGNVYLTQTELAAEAAKILEVDRVDDAIERLCAAGLLIREEAVIDGIVEAGIYTPPLFHAERGLADRILTLAGAPNEPGASSTCPSGPTGTAPGIGRGTSGREALFTGNDPEAVLDDVLRTLKVELSPEQGQAVRVALSARFSIITGGPGTGKTTTTQAVVSAFERAGRIVMLASPTGRAAKRLAEVVGRDAKTIHRLLEFSPEMGGFKRCADLPLECDVLVVDEVSMLDTNLAFALMRAVPAHAQVVFVGDVDQLPSVGPGNVLSDIIESAVVPVTRLTQVFRQAAASLIITNAHRINQGEMPRLPSASEGFDCVFVRADEPEELVDKVVAIVGRSLPKRGFRADEIQVLCPMQRGTCGAVVLNQRLQAALNPARDGVGEVERPGKVFRVGDRVMQLVNDYDKAVYNGDIGRVIGVSDEESEMCVDFAGSKVYYPYADLDQLSLAYASSIHKSQGSEYPAVVLAVHTQHYMLLQRNLLYTALTRAKKMAAIVGSTRAIAMAVKKKSDIRRHTRLRLRLQKQELG
ncbi:MAG: ATP-dependent RecD-like DNA helicase [Capsulimonadaceae bacterium]